MPSIPAGTTSVVPLDGHLLPFLFAHTWEIEYLGSTIASSASAGGWNVVWSSGTSYAITVTSGATASTGSAYEFRIKPSVVSGEFGDSGHFDVGGSGTARSQRVNIGTAHSQRVNIAQRRSQRVNVTTPYARSQRINIGAGRSQRVNIDYPHARSQRVNIATARSQRMNVTAPFARSQRVNVGSGFVQPAGIRNVAGGSSSATGPGTYNGVGAPNWGAFFYASGDMPFSFDFSATVVWRKDGFQTTYECDVDCALGFKLRLVFDDVGGLALAFAPGVGNTFTQPCWDYSTGDYIAAPVLLWKSANLEILHGYRLHTDGTAYFVGSGTGVDDPVLIGVIDGVQAAPNDALYSVHYVPIHDGDAFTVSGAFNWSIHADEYKSFLYANYLDGPGEPPGGMQRIPFAFPHYQFSYAVTNVNCRWGQRVNGVWHNSDFTPPLAVPIGGPPQAPVGTFGVGQRWSSYPNSYGTVPVNPQESANFAFDGGTSVFVFPEDAAYTSGSRDFQLTLSNIRFRPGFLWYPKSYDGLPSGSSGKRLTVSPGSIVSHNCAFNITAASQNFAHLKVNIYEGDALASNLYQVQFGNAQASSNVPGMGRDNGTVNFVTLDVPTGSLDTFVPQMRSRYSMDGTWTPVLPSARDDYHYNNLTLLPVDGYDQTCYLLDDYVWTPTTFAHATSTTIDTFGSTAGWSVTNGTKADNTSLTVTGTASGCVANSPSNYGKDCRNFRYLRLDVNSSAAGSGLTLLINGAKTFTTPALASGSQMFDIDLCQPSGVSGADETRTGWDLSPGSIYGVQKINTLAISGIANAQTVTFNSFALVRHDSHCPGRVTPESTGLSKDFVPQVEWFPPDVAAPGLVCPLAGNNPDDIYTTLQLASDHLSHHLYARLLQDRVDGKVGADIPHAIGNFPFLDSAGKPFYAVKGSERQSIAQFCAIVNAQTGLSCLPPAAGSPADWYGTDNAAIWLTRDNGIVAADPTDDLASAALTCRLGFLGIRYYPGQYSAMDYSSLKRLGTVVNGTIVRQGGGDPTGIDVSLALCRTDTPYPVQHKTAAADGYYRFGFSPGGYLWKDATNLATGYPVSAPRALRWIGLVGSLPSGAKGVSYDVSEGGRHVRAYLLLDTIRVGLAMPARPARTADWTDRDTGFAESWPVVRWEKGKAAPRLLLLSVASGALKLRASTNEGASWSMVALSASGTVGTLVETNHGLKYIYYRTSSGAIKGQCLDSQDTVVIAEFTAVASGVDDTGIDADHHTVGGGKWFIGLFYMASGVPTYKTAIDGQNFS